MFSVEPTIDEVWAYGEKEQNSFCIFCVVFYSIICIPSGMSKSSKRRRMKTSCKASEDIPPLSMTHLRFEFPLLHCEIPGTSCENCWMTDMALLPSGGLLSFWVSMGWQGKSAGKLVSSYTIYTEFLPIQSIQKDRDEVFRSNVRMLVAHSCTLQRTKTGEMLRLW